MLNYDEDVEIKAGIEFTDVDFSHIDKSLAEIQRAVKTAFDQTNKDIDSTGLADSWAHAMDGVLDSTMNAAYTSRDAWKQSVLDTVNLLERLSVKLKDYEKLGWQVLSKEGVLEIDSTGQFEHQMDQIFATYKDWDDIILETSKLLKEQHIYLGGEGMYDTANEKLVVLQRAFSELYEELKDVTSQYTRFTDAIQQTPSGEDLIGDSITAFHPDDGLALLDFMNDAEIESKQVEAALTLVNKKLKEIDPNASAASDAMDKLGDNPWSQLFISAGEKVIGVLKQITQHLIKIASTTIKNGIRKVGEAIRGIGKDSTSAGDSMKQLFRNIMRYGFGIRSLYFLFRRLRKAISEGLSNLEEFGGQSNSATRAITQLKDSITYLKNAWGAAFAPIITYIAPILNTLITLLVNAANAVAAFFATLTGRSSVVRAVKTQSTLGSSASGTADALEEEAEAAEDAKTQLAGFDDLDVLEQDPSNLEDAADALDDIGSGGGGSLGESMFEEVPINKEIADWLNTDDWYELGKLVAEKLNGLLQIVDDWINNVFRPQGKIWATRLATFLNGLIDNLDWELLGKTIADGLNAIADIFNTFIERVDWINLGKQLQKAVNSLFNNIEVDTIGKALANKWNWLIDTIYGFVSDFEKNAYHYGEVIGDIFYNWFTGIHWEELGASVGQGLMSISEVIAGFASDDAQWEGIKESIYNGVRSMLDNFDATQFASNINSIITRLSEVLLSIPWDEVGYAIGSALGQLDWATILGTVVDIIGHTLSGAITGFLENTLTSDIIQSAQDMTDKQIEAYNAYLDGKYKTLEEAYRAFGVIGTQGFEEGLTVEQVVDDTTTTVIDKTQGAVDTVGASVDTGVADITQTVTDGSADMTEAIAENLTETQKLSAEAMAYIDQSVSEFLSNQTETIDTMFMDALARLHEEIALEVETILLDTATAITTAITDLTTIVTDDVTMLLTTLDTNIVTQTTTTTDWLRTTITTTLAEFDTLIITAVTKTLQALYTMFVEKFGEVSKLTEEEFKKIEDSITKHINAAAEAVESAAPRMVAALQEVQDVVNSIVGGLQEVVTLLTTTDFGSIGNMSSGSGVNTLQIPHAANGLVIPPNKEFLAVYGDQRQGTNIEAPLDTIVQAFQSVVGNMEVQNTGYSEMTLDGETFARLATPYVVSELNRLGYDITVLEG